MMHIHPLVRGHVRFPTAVALLGGAAVFGLATPAMATRLPAAPPRELTVVRDLSEQARFEAECARELRGEID